MNASEEKIDWAQVKSVAQANWTADWRNITMPDSDQLVAEARAYANKGDGGWLLLEGPPVGNEFFVKIEVAWGRTAEWIKEQLNLALAAECKPVGFVRYKYREDKPAWFSYKLLPYAPSRCRTTLKLFIIGKQTEEELRAQLPVPAEKEQQ